MSFETPEGLGFQVDGEEKLQIHPLRSEGESFMSFGGSDWDIFPFEPVDCMTECGVPGWWEIHALTRESE